MNIKTTNLFLKISENKSLHRKLNISVVLFNSVQLNNTVNISQINNKNQTLRGIALKHLTKNFS